MAYREQKTVNRVCDQKWQERSRRLHLQKIQAIKRGAVKPTVDNKAPLQQPHMYLRLKKAAIEEDRQTKIERDNRILVKRMTEIMQRSAIETRNTSPLPGGGRVKSLNADRRRRELVKVTAENQALLRRIQQRGPTYNHLQWEQDRAKNEDYITRLARHPRKPDYTGTTAYYYDDQGAGPALGGDSFGEGGGDFGAPPPPASAPPAQRSQPSAPSGGQSTGLASSSASGGESTAAASSSGASSSGGSSSGGTEETGGDTEGSDGGEDQQASHLWAALSLLFLTSF